MIFYTLVLPFTTIYPCSDGVFRPSYLMTATDTASYRAASSHRKSPPISGLEARHLWAGGRQLRRPEAIRAIARYLRSHARGIGVLRLASSSISA